MEVSLLDTRPQELLLLTLDGLGLEYHVASTAGVAYQQVRGEGGGAALSAQQQVTGLCGCSSCRVR